MPTKADSLNTHIQATLQGINKAFRKGFKYRKGGVMLMGIYPNKERQYDLLSSRNEVREESVMTALDAINQRYGSNTIFYAATGIKNQWQMMRQLKSPHYTTDWNELPVVG